MERDIARPRWLCHTREGEPLARAGVTRPPICRMRLISSGESGLWSIVRSMASSAPGLSRILRATMARESPELAIHMRCSLMMHVTAVVPLTLASTFSARSASTRMYASRNASPASFAPSDAALSCSRSAAGRF